jgi:beta-lactamase superfamily II metal-dependent hydrolase
VIISDTATFLVDCYNIGDYSHLLPSTKKIRGVFITHQHEDHYSGLRYLRDEGFSIDCLIYSPYDRRRGDNSVTVEEWTEFNALKDFFAGAGTKLYAQYRQSDWSKPWWDTNGVRFWIIGPHKTTADSDMRAIHDASLVIKAHIGKRACLFAGDASDACLEYIANNTTKYCGDILHASHHGSLEGAHTNFSKKCYAQYTLVSTASGKYENVPHPTALRRYRENTVHDVWRTDVDGSCKWTF